MKRSHLLCRAIPMILILTLLAAGCTSTPPQGGGGIPTVTQETPGASACGLTTCHGLDLACGPNPPQVCTMEYRVGDKCRQFATCSNANGVCKLVTTPQFDRCKACVEKCGGGDSTEIFTCEEKC